VEGAARRACLRWWIASLPPKLTLRVGAPKISGKEVRTLVHLYLMMGKPIAVLCCASPCIRSYMLRYWGWAGVATVHTDLHRS
jgi:hypothetical protein